jgi:hypothetical protein
VNRKPQYRVRREHGARAEDDPGRRPRDVFIDEAHFHEPTRRDEARRRSDVE